MVTSAIAVMQGRATSQGMRAPPEAAGGREQILPAGGGWGEAQEEPALPTPGLQPGENNSGLLTSRTVRKYIRAVLSHRGCVICYSSQEGTRARRHGLQPENGCSPTPLPCTAGPRWTSPGLGLNLPELCLWVSWTWLLSLRGGVSHAHFLQNVCLKFFFFSWNKLIFHLVSVVRGLCCCPSSL